MRTMSDSLNLFRLAERLSIPQLVEAIKRGSIDPVIGQLVLNNKVKQRQKMMQAQASQQPERPSVAQENMMSGIAQIPVDENMYGSAQMAGGGIVSYAEGGPVEKDAIDYLSEKTGYSRATLEKMLGPTLISLHDAGKGMLDRVANRISRMRNGVLGDNFPVGLPSMIPTQMASNRVKGAIANSTSAEAVPEEALLTQLQQPRPLPPPEDGRPVNIPSFPGASVPAMNMRGYDDILAGLGGDRAERMSALSKQREAELAAGDKEAFKGIKDIIQRQRGNLSNVDKQNLYLSLIKGGLSAAAGDSQYALQNIARGGEEGVNSYIQRDVLNRANEQQLARDEQMMRLQELGTAKENRSMADRYAQGIAGLEQGDTSLRMGATNAANQNELAKAALGLQAQQINQQGAIQRAMLNSRSQYYQAQRDVAAARRMGIMQKAASDFMEGMPGKAIEAQLAKQYGANWRSVPDAQLEYNNALRSYVARRAEVLSTIMGGDEGGGLMGMVPDADALEQRGMR